MGLFKVQMQITKSFKTFPNKEKKEDDEKSSVFWFLILPCIKRGANLSEFDMLYLLARGWRSRGECKLCTLGCW